MLTDYYLDLEPIDRKVASAFAPGTAYANGGRVRDAIRSHFHDIAVPTAKDYDYVIIGEAEPSAVVSRLERHFRTNITVAGAKFPVFKLTVDGIDIDIALARREVSTGTGHNDFTVTFGPEVTLDEDAWRRDFSINMLSVDLRDGRVYAPGPSLDDLRAGRLRACSPKTFEEDPLRMVRGAQFASRFGYTIEPETAAAIRSAAHLMPTVSCERIEEELDKLLMRSPEPSLGIAALSDLRLLEHILPDLEYGRGMAQNMYHAHDVFTHNLKALDLAAAGNGDLVDRYAALLHDVGKPHVANLREDGTGHTFYGHESIGAAVSRRMLGQLRLSNEKIQDIDALVAGHMYAIEQSDHSPLPDAAIRRFITRTARESSDLDVVRQRVSRQFSLRACDAGASGIDRSANAALNAAFEKRVHDMIDRQPVINVKDLKITGTDVYNAIINVGLRDKKWRGDRLIGDTLKNLLEAVTDTPELNTHSRLIDATNKLLRNEVITLPVQRSASPTERTHTR